MVTDGLHRVSGDVTPDCTGDYLPAGIYNGSPYYSRDDAAYLIWVDVVDNWYISPALGDMGGPVWFRADPCIEGEYLDGVGATGKAYVTEI